MAVPSQDRPEMPPEALTLLAVVIFGAGMLAYHLALGCRRHD